MRSYILLFLLVALSIVFVYPQDKKAFKTQFMEADYFFYTGEFSESAFIYSELLKQDPDNANLKFLIGACYLSIPEEKSKALPYLEQAVESISPGYREGSYKERDAPPEAFFALARAYHIQNQLDKAVIFYEKYHNAMKLTDPAEVDFVHKQIESCRLAGKLIQKPLPYSRIPFGRDINTPTSNYNAIFTEADSVMIFMRRKPFYTAIMMTRLDKGAWTVPVVINDQLGVDDRTYVCSISGDGRELYLSMSDEEGISDIYRSIFKKNSWTKAEKLNGNIDTEYSETHASVSKDGKKLYFTSDRPGGIGAMDIWVSERDANNDWGNPVNLGEPVNSIYSEETPFISDDGKILYFSSMGHPTMGGFDVFFSTLIANGKWSYPANMGYPVSTCDDDLFFFPLARGQQAIYSGFMNRGEETQKVYFVNLDTLVPVNNNIALRGTIKLQDNVSELDESFAVKITDPAKKDTAITVIPDKKTGEFQVDLKPGNYVVTVEGKGYSTGTENISVANDINRNDIILEKSLAPEKVTSGEYLIIRNILFDFNDYSLSNDAKTELDKLYTAMQKYPQVFVQVTGHADSRGDADYNLKLSLRRARSVVAYLVGKGISNERFISSGIGEQMSIAMNQNPDGTDNPEGRRLNRYAEIKLLDNTDEKIIIKPIEVPDHLKPKTDTYYSILFAQTRDASYTPPSLEGAGISLIETDHARLFFSEEFNEKKKAVELLNFAIDNGFPDAQMLDRQRREDLILSLSDRIDYITPPFTIQVLALKVPVDPGKLGISGEVSLIQGKDGFSRYFTGYYQTMEPALKDLQQLTARFPDAFILPLSRYSGKTTAGQEKITTPAHYFTIQFNASRKPAAKDQFKDLGEVRVSFGEDGYYRYTLGLFDNRHDAEIELTRIREAGRPDAFIRKVDNDVSK